MKTSTKFMVARFTLIVIVSTLAQLHPDKDMFWAMWVGALTGSLWVLWGQAEVEAKAEERKGK